MRHKLTVNIQQQDRLTLKDLTHMFNVTIGKIMASDREAAACSNFFEKNCRGTKANYKIIPLGVVDGFVEFLRDYAVKNTDAREEAMGVLADIALAKAPSSGKALDAFAELLAKVSDAEDIAESLGTPELVIALSKRIVARWPELPAIAD